MRSLSFCDIRFVLELQHHGKSCFRMELTVADVLFLVVLVAFLTTIDIGAVVPATIAERTRVEIGAVHPCP